MKRRLHYRIHFPTRETGPLQSDEIYFYLWENGAEVKLRVHDYNHIYERPGLYEQLFFERLKCNSPQKALDILKKVLRENRVELGELRLLDLGAGNGMVGELFDVSRTVGVDICPEAQIACERDRPGAYDAYYVADLCNLDSATGEELREWRLDCLTCIAALGFGDIPTRAFTNAFNLIQPEGWVCFNIKETFLQESDMTGFSRLVKYLLLTDVLEVHHLERYRHRVSVEGTPLFYYMLAGRKRYNISDEILADGRFD